MASEAGTDALYQSNSIAANRLAVSRLLRTQQLRLNNDRPARFDPARPKVRVTVAGALPKLAWLCTIGAGFNCDLIVGPHVETGDRWAVEGVWDGRIGKSFASSQYFYGSGVTWGRRIVFAPPRHCWEYLFVLHDAETAQTRVSNSLNFVLEHAGIDAGGGLFQQIEANLFASTNAATAAGIDTYDPLVARDGRHSLYRMMFYNFSVDAAGCFKLYPTARPEAPFADFAAYRSFMVSKLAALGENATAPARRHTLPPMTPVSGGYDSACVAVLVREAGYRDAVTIDVKVKGRDDSGMSVATRLGMNVHRVAHVFGHDVPVLARALTGELAAQASEFVATPGCGDDIAFLAMEKYISGRTVLTGAMGDSVWRRNSTLPPGLPVRIIFGKSITEFRLRAGFAFVPVPSIGARFPRRVKRLTRSEEMQPFTLWAAYDRPIPRRVLEEAGLERGTFAIAKAATSPTILNRADLFAAAVARVRMRYRDCAGELQALAPLKVRLRKTVAIVLGGIAGRLGWASVPPQR